MQNVNKESVIRYVDGSKQQVIDSRDVAKMIGKSHAHLMRDIHDYINVLEPNPKLDSAQFFIESSYIDPNNQERPCYLLTKKVVNSLPTVDRSQRDDLHRNVRITVQ